jgi:type IX secretion system PorP/SprF family membrane protein
MKAPSPISSRLFGVALVHVLLVVSAQVFCQQDPIHALYQNNLLVINPANAGINKMLNANAQYRTQWAGLEANPTTLSVSGDMSIRENKLGVGFLALQDNIGDISNTQINAAVSYKIELNNVVFGFGMQGGFTRYATDPAALNIHDGGDPAFQTLTETKLNIGAGIMLKGERFLVGISAPRLLDETTASTQKNLQLYNQHFYLTGSVTIPVSSRLDFRPGTLLRYTSGAPISYDITTIVSIDKKYNAGLLTRSFNSYGALLQVAFKKYRFGYVYELPGSSSSSLGFSSHEVSIGLSVGFMKFHDSKEGF